MVPVAVLFDFDGVLVDSMPAHVEAWSAATRQIFGHGLSAKERRAIVGKSTRVIASQIAEWKSQPEAAQRISEHKRIILMDYLTKVEAYPGIRSFLALLHERNIPFGIASNAPRDYVRGVVAKLGLKVAVVLGCEDVANPKPAPDLYLLCAKQLGISPADHSQMVVFEDSTHGIQAAVRAGAMAIGITSNQPAKALMKAGAIRTYPGFVEVIADGFGKPKPAKKAPSGSRG